jgi:ribosome-associated protein YbcJ (S4-like RNA binding protein)
VTDIKGHVFDLDVWKKMATHLEDLLQGSRLVEHGGAAKNGLVEVWVQMVHGGGKGEANREA